MATAKKTTTPRSAAAKPAETASKPKRAATPRKSAKTIRNLRGCVVHLRLGSQKDPYRVELLPRGHNGDVQTVPASLTDDGTFVAGVDVLFEIITPAEAQALAQGYGPIGYLGRTDAPTIIHPDDATVMEAPDWDGKGRLPQDRQVKNNQATVTRANPTLADLPGSDTALHESLRREQRAGQSAMPPEAQFDRRVTVEHVQGE